MLAGGPNTPTSEHASARPPQGTDSPVTHQRQLPKGDRQACLSIRQRARRHEQASCAGNFVASGLSLSSLVVARLPSQGSGRGVRP